MAVSTVENGLSKMCDQVIFVNKFDRLMAVDMGIVPEHKALTIYNGVSEERLAPGLDTKREELLDELNLSHDVMLSVFVGRLDEQKGLKYLFEALRIVREKVLDVDFHQVVLGDGEQAEHCRQWVEEFGVADRVHFLGFRTDALRWTGGGYFRPQQFVGRTLDCSLGGHGL